MDVKPEFAEILRILVRHEARFLVVGGVASNLQGAGFFTEDLDILADVGDEGVVPLAAALESMGARYKDFAGRTFLPEAHRLRANRLNLLETRLGRVDVLRTMGRDRDFAALVPRSDEMSVEEFTLRVASLEDLIEAKEVADRPKDRMHLLVLRALLEERRRARQQAGPAAPPAPPALGE